jgi:Bacterial protein of unknown function (DUF885)
MFESCANYRTGRCRPHPHARSAQKAAAPRRLRGLMCPVLIRGSGWRSGQARIIADGVTGRWVFASEGCGGAVQRPRWSVPDGLETFSTWKEVTTVYHEGVPGHHLQVSQAIAGQDNLNHLPVTVAGSGASPPSPRMLSAAAAIISLNSYETDS